MQIPAYQPVVARLGRDAGEPPPDGGLVEVDEDAFAKLLDCRQPIGVTGDWRTTHRKLHVFKFSIRRRWCRLEPREAVQARHFAQPMHSNDIFDRGEINAVRNSALLAANSPRDAGWSCTYARPNARPSACAGVPIERGL